MVLGGGVFGRLLSLYKIRRLRPPWWDECPHRRKIRALSPAREDTATRHLSARHWICWRLGLGFPASRNVRSKCWVSYPVYGILVIDSELTRTMTRLTVQSDTETRGRAGTETQPWVSGWVLLSIANYIMSNRLHQNLVQAYFRVLWV